MSKRNRPTSRSAVAATRAKPTGTGPTSHSPVGPTARPVARPVIGTATRTASRQVSGTATPPTPPTATRVPTAPPPAVPDPSLAAALAPARKSAPASPHAERESSPKQWGIATLQAVPYGLAIYDFFMFCAQWHLAAAAIIGAILIIATPLLRLWQVWHMAQPWLGEPLMAGRSILFLGLSLVTWSAWDYTGNSIFSLLAVLELATALFFMVRAQHDRPLVATV